MLIKMRAVRFPEATSLTDLFEHMEVVAHHNEDPIGETPLATSNEFTKGTTIGSFCSTHRLKGQTLYLRVKPNQTTVEAVTERVLTDYDRMYFELTERADGTVLVTAKSNKILQGIWLALLPDRSSVPADLFEN
jgi:hypothetical protein